MQMTAEQTEKWVQKITRIFDAYKQVSSEIQKDMDIMACDYGLEDKTKMSKMILKLIRACRTSKDVDDVLEGRCAQTDLVREMDEIAITGGIYIIEDLSKKYAGKIPHLDDFEFMTDDELNKLAAAIAQGKQMTDIPNAGEEKQAVDSANFANDKDSSAGAAAQVPHPTSLDALFGEEIDEPGTWIPTPYQEFLINEADNFSMVSNGYAYPLTPTSLLDEPFREIVLRLPSAFNEKYADVPFEKRLSLCQTAQTLIDKTQTAEDTRLFFVRPKGQKAEILPAYADLSYQEKNFLKEAAMFYFQYKEEHPDFIKAGIRKICGWMGKTKRPAHTAAHQQMPQRSASNGRERD